MARNSQIDKIRKVTLKSIELDEDTIKNNETPENIFFRNHDLGIIRSAIKKIKPHERELIYLYYFEEQNYREISLITGIPQEH